MYNIYLNRVTKRVYKSWRRKSKPVTWQVARLLAAAYLRMIEGQPAWPDPFKMPAKKQAKWQKQLIGQIPSSACTMERLLGRLERRRA